MGYSVGRFELALISDGASDTRGTVVYWGAPDAKAAVKRLEALGSTVRDVGDGLRVATVSAQHLVSG